MKDERLNLRIPQELKIRLSQEAGELGITLNQYCEMKLSKDSIAIVGSADDLAGMYNGLLRAIEKGVPSYHMGGTEKLNKL